MARRQSKPSVNAPAAGVTQPTWRTLGRPSPRRRNDDDEQYDTQHALQPTRVDDEVSARG
jgi:hypothetical protein